MEAFKAAWALEKTAPVRARVVQYQVADSHRPLGYDDACAQRYLMTSRGVGQMNFRL